MRVAIVHDWLYVLGGAELVLAEMLKCFPDADVYTLFDFLSDKDRAQLGVKETRTSFLQKIPGMKNRHRYFLPLMPFAIQQFDLSGYDLIISSSYAVAKGVITGPSQTHISYIHSPMRYAWDLQESYFSRAKLNPVLGLFARYMLHNIRIWDASTANGPDLMLANSAFVARRIRKIYGREAKVVFPPVRLSTNGSSTADGDYFLAASRLVPYKNMEQIVRAFATMPDKHLVVSGDGPQLAFLKKIATANVIFKGFIPTPELRRLMAGARAFIFAAEEDFGIVPVEAMSEGTPVLALGRGGCLETVVPGRTGLFFSQPTPEAIAACVEEFCRKEHEFSPSASRERAAIFAADVFRANFMAAVDQALNGHYRNPSEIAPVFSARALAS